MIESQIKQSLNERIHQYLHGNLSPREVDELWAEVIQDEERLEYLKNMANLKKAAIRSKRENRIVATRKRWSYLAAAVIVMILGVIGVIRYSAQAPDIGNGIQPISKIELDYYRSANMEPNKDGESKIIRKAVILANSGKVEQAIHLLKNELNNSTKADWTAKLNVNLGSLYFNQGQYQKAVVYYSNIISNKENVDLLLLEKAYWYCGNAFFHMDKLKKAKTNIQKAYNLNGAYRRVAKSYLDAMASV